MDTTINVFHNYLQEIMLHEQHNACSYVNKTEELEGSIAGKPLQEENQQKH